MRQKRYFKTIVCLILGAVLLTGSAVANYENASGYTKLKSGILNMLTVENFSANGKLTASFNGTELGSEQVEYQYDRNGVTSEYSKTIDSYGDSEHWIQDGLYINNNIGYGYGIFSANDKGFNDTYLAGTDDKEMIDKIVNFAELLSDTLIGDLKNNFVLVSSENGISTYQIDLNREQIPELIQSGMNVVFNSRSYGGYVTYADDFNSENFSDEDWNSYYEKAYEVLAENDYSGVVLINSDGTNEYFEKEADYYLATGNGSAHSLDSMYSLLDGDQAISGLSCTATLDSQGRLTYLKATGTVTGKNETGDEQKVTIDLELSIYDYGTTSIEPFDKSLLNFDWEIPEDEHFYYDFDSEGNLIDYSSYEDDGYGDMVVTDVAADVVEPLEADKRIDGEFTEEATVEAGDIAAE